MKGTLLLSAYDEWSGLADMPANLIEKYASDLDIENLPDITVDNHAEEKNLSLIHI